MVQPVTHATWETDVGDSQVQVQPALHRVPEAILGDFVRPCLSESERRTELYQWSSLLEVLASVQGDKKVKCYF